MKHKKYLIVLALTAMTLTLSGCGNQADNSPANTVSTEIAATESVETTPDVEATEDVSVAATPEAAETTEEEPAPEETMENWLTEVGKQGTICMAVWNDANSTKHIIENDETYEMQEGDRFFICTPSKLKKSSLTMRFKHEYGKPSDNYVEIKFPLVTPKEDIACDITCSNGEQGSTNFTLTCSIPDKLMGLHWANELGYDTPKMVVWNDTTGFKQELESPATYQLCVDDQLAIYSPEEYYIDSKNYQGNHTILSHVAFIDWTQIDLGEAFDLEITMRHFETLEPITFHVTLLPVQQ